jgi:hypothetical protein
MKTIAVIVFIQVSLLANTFASAADIKYLNPVQFNGDIKAPEDVSAIGLIGTFIVIGADEAVGDNENQNIIQVMQKEAKDQYRVVSEILLFEGDEQNGKEMDIEGIAIENRTIFIVGSHSSKRGRIKTNKSYKKNRKKFRDKNIEDEINRDKLFRLEVDAQLNPVNVESISLRKLIQDHKVLKTYSEIPSKENGIDIEGIAADDGWLYIGFRGPVFRDNYVPVLKLRFDDPGNTSKLLYVNLGGGGIRDMVKISDGFLILSGPVGDGPGPYQLHHWDGKDLIPGKNREPKEMGKIKLLGEIDVPKGGKAEGITVLSENEGGIYEFVIVYDGAQKGMPRRFQTSGTR